jgi:hypothetical protein
VCVCNGLVRGRGNQARRCQYLDAVAHDYLALKDATWGSDYWWERANSDGREMHKILDWEGWESQQRMVRMVMVGAIGCVEAWCTELSLG